MAKNLLPKLYRVSTGMTAFVVAGLLVFSILDENGGNDSSQEQWQEVDSRAILIDRNVGILAEVPEYTEPQFIDQTVTGSISQTTSEEEQATKNIPESENELSVLALIRKNSDVAPGVSTGTARVSVTVKKGDTLFNIGRRHGLSVSELAQLNALEEPFTIKIGQTLYVAR